MSRSMGENENAINHSQPADMKTQSNTKSNTTIFMSFNKCLESLGGFTKSAARWTVSLIGRGAKFVLRRVRILGKKSAQPETGPCKRTAYAGFPLCDDQKRRRADENPGGTSQGRRKVFL